MGKRKLEFFIKYEDDQNNHSILNQAEKEQRVSVSHEPEGVEKEVEQREEELNKDEEEQRNQTKKNGFKKRRKTQDPITDELLDLSGMPPEINGKLAYYKTEEDLCLIDLLSTFTDNSRRDIGVSGFWVTFSKYYNTQAPTKNDQYGFNFVPRNKDSIRRRFNRIFKKALEDDVANGDSTNDCYKKAVQLGKSMMANTSKSKRWSSMRKAQGFGDETISDGEKDLGNNESSRIISNEEEIIEQSIVESEVIEDTVIETVLESPTVETVNNDVDQNKSDKNDTTESLTEEPFEMVVIKKVAANLKKAKKQTPVKEIDRIKIIYNTFDELSNELTKISKEGLTDSLKQIIIGLVESDEEKKQIKFKLNSSIEKIEKLEVENQKLKAMNKNQKKSKKYHYKYKYKDSFKIENKKLSN